MGSLVPDGPQGWFPCRAYEQDETNLPQDPSGPAARLIFVVVRVACTNKRRMHLSFFRQATERSGGWGRVNV